MQYKYIECNLPSNGLIYKTKTVHLRAKTIFDIKSLLNNPIFQLQSEIDALNNCIDPKDNVDVYDLVNQDVVYLLYKLRSLSDDTLYLNYEHKQYKVSISDLDVKTLESWDTKRILPESKYEVILSYVPIKKIFNFVQEQKEFIEQYPDYKGDIVNTISILNSVAMLNNKTDKTFIRNELENLSWKDSLYLIKEIENFQQQDFGVVEEVKLTVDDKGNEVTVPIKITEEFFRPAL